MVLRTIKTGSGGNCYALIDSNGEILLLDLGATESEIKRGIDWKIANVSKALVTHSHADHAMSMKKMKQLGISVYAPFIECRNINIQYGLFHVRSFDLTTLDKHWTHTNLDGSECPCYGFQIEHEEMGKLLYITDTELVKWRFNGVDHVLLGVNYDKELIAEDSLKRTHVVRGHMSIQTACDFVKSINPHYGQLQNVVMCHLSGENAEADTFIGKMKTAAKNANISIAGQQEEVTLMRAGEVPF